jgi:ABC-type multidrug transport system ATPase subunit
MADQAPNPPRERQPGQPSSAPETLEGIPERHSSSPQVDTHGEVHSPERVGVRREEPAIVDEELRRLSTGQAPQTRPEAGGAARTIHWNGTRLAIGRDFRNDVVLDDPNVSQFHAELRAAASGVEVLDLGSRNGTRVNGEITDRAEVHAGVSIGIGSLRLVFDGRDFLAHDDYGLLRLQAEAITVRIKQRLILDAGAFSLGPAELVAIIGESGAGKTTLLKTLAGVRRPNSGLVSVNGEPLISRLTDIGYVPQDEIHHDYLTLHEALRYSARLRLPDDANEEQINARVQHVLGELALLEHAQTRIRSLSGGQRRRTSVAMELLGRPSLLLLDEPTTGMDPWLESKMMSLFRELADRSRGVALVTHATKSLEMCDRIVALNSNGTLVFDGSPSDALEYFGVEYFDDIYPALRSAAPSVKQPRPDGASAPDDERTAERAAVARSKRPRRRSALRQTRILTSRYARLITRDRRNLMLLLLQPPMLGLAGGGLFTANVFARPRGSVGDAVEVLFLAVLVMVWIGSLNSIREVIKERAILSRESALGVRVIAYIASKLAVLFSLVVLQTLLYAGVLLAFLHLHASPGVYAELLALLMCTGFVAVAMGLCISAAVTTEDQATTALPLAFIPQLIFAGAIVPVASMAAPAHALAAVTFSRWSLASLGSSVDINHRLVESSQVALLHRVGTHFFNVAPVPGMLIQGAFMAALLAGTAVLLRRG